MKSRQLKPDEQFVLLVSVLSFAFGVILTMLAFTQDKPTTVEQKEPVDIDVIACERFGLKLAFTKVEEYKGFRPKHKLKYSIVCK